MFETDSTEIVEDATTVFQTITTVAGAAILLCYTYRACRATVHGVKKLKAKRALRRELDETPETVAVPA